MQFVARGTQVRGGKTVHATNQPTTRPADAEERKDTASETAGEILVIYGQRSRWETSRKHYNGCPRSTSQHHRPLQAKQQKHSKMQIDAI